jgi:hypothetical protein
MPWSRFALVFRSGSFYVLFPALNTGGSAVVSVYRKKKINVLVKECFGAVLPEPVEGMRDRWAG